MSRYQLTLEARTDLDDIADYILARTSFERTRKILARFNREFQKLARNPGLGHYRDDLLDRRFRFWSLFSFVIVYRWDVEPVQIIAIVHGARDLDGYVWKHR